MLGQGLTFSSRFISTVGSIATTFRIDAPGWLAKVALVSMTYALMSVSARPLPTVTVDADAWLSRLKMSSSTKDQPRSRPSRR